ncbi:Calcium-binding protein CAST [Heracleum sosnowskyi]|uniref:Calcium-binding protein CAST n=1 Tax=Heracleum sosnowskyi TaxID=360622 RepID=A0AAD8ISZ7_9APIA|nr:Calcium-binding protein CAST [Heracleum sosnowskyi]KAK1391131.1 Calcium-binding protein CAST [Heracleum sosnowskyi]
MEDGDQAKGWKRSLSRSSNSNSFKLRSPSLNSVRLRRIFDMFDKSNDGMLTADELSQALSILGLEADPSEIDSMISSYVKPGNQGLTFEDFEALHQSLNKAFFADANDDAPADEEDSQESDLSEAFKVFDEDGDGFISAKELQVVLGKLGFPEGREIDRVELMISSVDRNHDGRVDFFEFKDMMRNVMVRSG